MLLFPARALWPARDRVPLLRLGLALVAAPGILALLLGSAVFLVMGMTEVSGEAVMRETLRATGALALLIFGFTFTFGLVGIALVWALGRRDRLAWALSGASAGALAGAVFGAIAMSGVGGTMVLASAIAGWVILLLIRRLAGVGRAIPPP